MKGDEDDDGEGDGDLEWDEDGEGDGDLEGDEDDDGEEDGDLEGDEDDDGDLGGDEDEMEKRMEIWKAVGTWDGDRDMNWLLTPHLTPQVRPGQFHRRLWRSTRRISQVSAGETEYNPPEGRS